MLTPGGCWISPPTAPEFRLAGDRKCGQCHADRLARYRETFHGKAIALGQRPGGEGERATFRHRVAGVDGEVEERVLQLVRIDVHPRQVRGEVGLQPDPRADRAAHELGEGGDLRVDVGADRRERLAPGEGQQLVRHRRRPLGALYRVVQAPAQGAVRGQAALDPVEIELEGAGCPGRALAE